MRRLDDLLSAAGTSDVPCCELEGLAGAVERCAEGLASAWLGMEGVLAAFGMCSGGERPGIEKAAALGALADTCPEPLLHLQSSALTELGSAAALENLSVIQAELVEAESGLGARLYMDEVPAESELRAAIRGLRRTAGWLRFFRRDYRSARALHRGLQRNRQAKADDGQRLNDLEALLRLFELKAQWEAALRRRFLGIEARVCRGDSPRRAAGTMPSRGSSRR
ncbi:MAG: hypothetical protein ACTHJX_10045 [Terriglobales bacterium]